MVAQSPTLQWQPAGSGRTRRAASARKKPSGIASCSLGRQAEIAGEYLKKGRPVYVEGRLKTRKWQDKEGVERYTTEIVAEELQLLGGREGAGGGADSDGGFTRESAPARSEGGGSGGGGGARSAPSKKPASNFDDMDDDIPF